MIPEPMYRTFQWYPYDEPDDSACCNCPECDGSRQCQEVEVVEHYIVGDDNGVIGGVDV